MPPSGFRSWAWWQWAAHRFGRAPPQPRRGCCARCRSAAARRMTPAASAQRVGRQGMRCDVGRTCWAAVLVGEVVAEHVACARRDGDEGSAHPLSCGSQMPARQAPHLALAGQMAEVRYESLLPGATSPNSLAPRLACGCSSRRKPLRSVSWEGLVTGWEVHIFGPRAGLA
eukprot:366226-Chlamydomonas_euryale.AAC.24